MGNFNRQPVKKVAKPEKKATDQDILTKISPNADRNHLV